MALSFNALIFPILRIVHHYLLLLSELFCLCCVAALKSLPALSFNALIFPILRIVHHYLLLSDLAKGGLESGVWIDEYNYQNKDKNITKSMSLLFIQCSVS